MQHGEHRRHAYRIDAARAQRVERGAQRVLPGEAGVEPQAQRGPRAQQRGDRVGLQRAALQRVQVGHVERVGGTVFA